MKVFSWENNDVLSPYHCTYLRLWPLGMFSIIKPIFFLEKTKGRGGWRHFHLLRHAKRESAWNQEKVSCVSEDKMPLKPELQTSWFLYGIFRIKISHCRAPGLLPEPSPWMQSISLKIIQLILRAECNPQGTTSNKTSNKNGIIICFLFSWQCFIPLRYNWSQESPLLLALKLQEIITEMQDIFF